MSIGWKPPFSFWLSLLRVERRDVSTLCVFGLLQRERTVRSVDGSWAQLDLIGHQQKGLSSTVFVRKAKLCCGHQSMALHILPQWTVMHLSQPGNPTSYSEARSHLLLHWNQKQVTANVLAWWVTNLSLFMMLSDFPRGDIPRCLLVPDSGTHGRAKKWLHSSPVWWTDDFIYRSMAYQEAAESPKPHQSII